MPTHLEEAIKVILGPNSKLRDKTPRIYALPKDELSKIWLDWWSMFKSDFTAN